MAATSMPRVGSSRINRRGAVASQRAITAADARRAGFGSKRELLASLRSDGRLYRIEFRRIGDDPRISLRKRSELSDEERAELDKEKAELMAREARRREQAMGKANRLAKGGKKK